MSSRRRLAYAIVGALLVLTWGATAVLWRWKAPLAVQRRLEQWTRHRVSVGAVTINARLELVARDVRIAGAPPFEGETLAFAHRVVVRLRGPAGFWSPSQVTVDGLDVDYLGSSFGDNVRPAPATERAPTVARTRVAALAWPRLIVRQARLRGSLAVPYGPRLQFRVSEAELERATDGRIDAKLRQAVVDVEGWASLRASALAVRSPPREDPRGTWRLTSEGDVSVEVPGGGTLVDKLALAAKVGHGHVDVELRDVSRPQGEPMLGVRAEAAGFSMTLDVHALGLRPLAALGMKAGLGFDRAQASLAASVAVDRTGLTSSFAVKGELTGADLLHAALDSAPWRNQSLVLELTGSGNLASNRLELTSATFRTLGATVGVRGWLDTSSAPKGSVVIETPKPSGLPCASLFRWQAEPVKRALAGMELGGALGFRVLLDFDAANWDELRLGVDVNPRCSVIREPSALAELLPLLRKPKSEPPLSARLPLGPYHPDFAPLSRMPPHLPSAFVTAEDGKFFRHHGFDTEMIEHVLAQDLESRSFDRGASTITQQLAKNLFLSHRRTLARKLEEAVLTWRLQRLLSKERTLELYLNIIELGPGVRGVKRAAQLYFGKDVEALSPLESAHLAALTPNPHVLARRFRDGRVDESWQQRLYDLLGMMKRHGRLSADALARARSETLVLRDLGKK